SGVSSLMTIEEIIIASNIHDSKKRELARQLYIYAIYEIWYHYTQVR
ncbi:7077_t:CDS:1, partial [Racocetra persica]